MQQHVINSKGRQEIFNGEKSDSSVIEANNKDEITGANEHAHAGFNTYLYFLA